METLQTIKTRQALLVVYLATPLLLPLPPVGLLERSQPRAACLAIIRHRRLGGSLANSNSSLKVTFLSSVVTPVVFLDRAVVDCSGDLQTHNLVAFVPAQTRITMQKAFLDRNSRLQVAVCSGTTLVQLQVRSSVANSSSNNNSNHNSRH